MIALLELFHGSVPRLGGDWRWEVLSAGLDDNDDGNNQQNNNQQAQKKKKSQKSLMVDLENIRKYALFGH